MSLKLIIPRDPLIFRDGKPFTAVPGERSRSLSFPFPATLAGAARTREGTNSGTVDFKKSKDEIEKLKARWVRGPILVELEANGKISQWFFPAPADALLVKRDGRVIRHRLSPLDVADDRYSNLRGGLSLVGPAEVIRDKPLNKPPLYWTLKTMEEWLLKPADGAVDVQAIGIHGPVRETRTHVSIDPETQSALSGALFQTSGIEFTLVRREEHEQPRLNGSHHLGLALETDAAFEDGVDFLGGERRVIRWEKADGNLPVCPPEIKTKIKENGFCRLILATPAYFEEGYLPAKYKAQVKAAALPRYQTISGWDYDIRKPKPTRRLAPAGAVYFMSLAGLDIDEFLEQTWLQSISDDEQSCNDGFGLALLGIWDGEKRKMKMEAKDE
jgi:CRISPR-associated protein Cmr3